MKRIMKKLIVNADDFGSHELVNSAIEDAFNSGICRSASLMAGGKFFNHAVEIAKSHKDLGVGIHFTLVKGSPVLPPSAAHRHHHAAPQGQQRRGSRRYRV